MSRIITVLVVLLVTSSLSGCMAALPLVGLASFGASGAATGVSVGQYTPEGSPLNQFSDRVRATVSGESMDEYCRNEVAREAVDEQLTDAEIVQRLRERCDES